MYKLGIDIGGTHIDFAVVDQDDQLLYGHKMLAEGDFQDYFKKGMESLINHYNVKPEQVHSIHLGTTLAINALLERKSLYKVGVVRLASHAPDLPPAYLWPNAYRDHILVGCQAINGGREYNNVSLSALHEIELLDAVTNLMKLGAESFALVSVFSPFYAEDELMAASLIREKIGNIPVTLSHQIGSLGFIERENATILNATLKKVMLNAFDALQNILNECGFNADCYITENNGTLMTLAEASAFPVKTISSGATNSIVGACRLANCKEGIVVDIGGTSTDIGIIKDGFPLYSLEGGTIANIPCRLLMPDVVSLAMGGGSVIRSNNIGPDSVGAALLTMCKVAGGEVLTLYDIGEVLRGSAKNIDINKVEAEKIIRSYLREIKEEINKLLCNASSMPILLVGGGASIIPDYLLDKQFIRPSNYAIANAYGAALSEVAGQVDCIVNLNEESNRQLQALEESARQIAIQKGAQRDSLKIIEKKILPLHYMPEPRHRVIITVAGRLNT